MIWRRFSLGRLFRVVAVIALLLCGLFAALIALYSFEPPVSTLMLGRKVLGKSYERSYVRLRDISPALMAAVITSEDARFCQNDGVDWGALHNVIEKAGVNGPRRGASTITMQTAKNLFLWPGRSSIRKGVEIAMALVMGKVWTKPQTLEVYLNVAEWGDGIYGVEAAAQHYFHKRASQLDAREAALLATSLPNPIKRDPAHPRPFQRRLADGLMFRVSYSADWLGCLPR